MSIKNKTISFGRRVTDRDFYRTRNGKIFANLVSSVAFKYINLAINLAMVPLTLSYLDNVRYGLWMALYSILSWFVMFDIGIGDGLRNKLVELKAHGDTASSKKYVSTAYFLFGIIALIVTIAYAAIGNILDWAQVLNAPASMKHELNFTAEAIIALVCANLILRLINNVLAADLKNAVSGAFSVSAHLISLIGIIILSRLSDASIAKYAFLYMGADTMTMLVASIYLYGGPYKDIAPSIKSIDISLWKDLVPIGMKFFFLTICSTLIVQATGFLISNLLGPEYVTDYSINNRYFSMATMVFAMMVQPLWSGYGEAYHRGDFVWIKRTISRLHKVLLLVVLVMLVMLVSQKIVFRIWLADRISVNWTMSILFCFYYFFYMIKSIYQPLINSTSKIKLQMIAHASMGVLYLVAVVFFVKTLGLGVNGVVLALIVAYSLPLALLSRLQAYKILTKSGGIWSK